MADAGSSSVGTKESLGLRKLMRSRHHSTVGMRLWSEYSWCAIKLTEEGIHPKVVSERLGHSTIGITLDTYSHVIDGVQEEAAAKIDAAFGPLVDRKA